MDRTLIIRFDARTLVLAGAIVVMAAAFLPWVRLPPFLVGDLALRGLSAGGWATLTLAFIAALSLLLPWQPLNRVSLPAAFLSIWIHLIALAAFVRTVQWATTLEMDPLSQLGAVGSGLMLTFAGAWLMLFGGVGNATPPVTLRWQRGWMGYAAWGGLLVVVLVSCLCAWSIGLIVQPYGVANPATPAATFGPAPTVYMATPLIDVQLEPLGQPGVAPTAVPVGPHATPSPGSTAGANLAIPPSPTSQPKNLATLTATVNPAHSATPTLAIFSNSATLTAVASPGVRTSTPTPSATPSPTNTTQPGVATSTPSPSATSTATSTSNPSPLQTSTPQPSPLELPR